MLTLTNGRSLRDGLETIGRERLSMSREDIESLGREGLKAGRERLNVGREGLQSIGREGLQSIGSSVADLAETLPLRPRRRRSFPLIGAIAVAIAGAAVIALIARIQMRRSALRSPGSGSHDEGRFDRDAFGGTADDGRGTRLAASAADDLDGSKNGATSNDGATPEYAKS